MKAGRILVVDDEPTMADGLRLVLEAEGHSVVTAGSAAQAVEAANGHGFHLAIVDLVLPDGRRVHSDRPVTALCVCRRSRRYPF